MPENCNRRRPHSSSSSSWWWWWWWWCAGGGVVVVVSACVSPRRHFWPILRSPYHSRIVEKRLVSSAKVVAHLEGDAAALRYFSVVEIDDGAVWVFAKNGTYPHASTKSSIVGFESCWPSGCSSSPRLVLDGTSESHNFAVIYQRGQLFGFGGMLTSARREIFPSLFLSQKFVRFSSRASLLPSLSEPVKGCIELRRGKTCEFDGRFSLASLGDRTLLYARANTRPEGGGRFVQVASSHTRAKNQWSSFERISFLKGNGTIFQSVLSSSLEATERADVYFASVQNNPALDGTLLGFFPTVVRTSHERTRDWKAHAAILLSLSLDGATFSPPVALVKASPAGGEINDHVVDGLLVRGDRIFFYVHSGVPGTLVKLCPFRYLHSRREPPAEYFDPSSSSSTTILPETRLYDDDEEGKITHLPPPSHVVRYTMHMDALRNWSLRTAADLTPPPPPPR